MVFSLAVIAVVVGGFALFTMKSILVPLMVAYFLTNAMGPPMDYLKRKGVPRWAAFPLILVLTGVVFYVLGELFYRQVLLFRDCVDQYDDRFNTLWQGFLGALPDPVADSLRVIDWNKLLPGRALASFTVSAVGGIFGFLGTLVMVLLYMTFILIEREGLRFRVLDAYGGEKGKQVLEVLAAVRMQTESYVAGKTLVSLLTGFLTALVLFFFGVKFYLFWGILTFLLNFIPNIGSLIATVFPLAFSVIQPDPVFGAMRVLCLAASLVTIQFLVGNFLEPRLLGKRLSLSPLVVLLSLVVWGWIWGIWYQRRS